MGQPATADAPRVREPDLPAEHLMGAARWDDVAVALHDLAGQLNERGAWQHAMFAELYATSVEHWRAARTLFGDPAFVERVVVSFYRLYVDAVVRPVLGRAAHRRTLLWDRYFVLADRWQGRSIEWPALAILRAGVVAHVRGDLPDAFRLARRGADTSGSAADVLGPASTSAFRAAAASYVGILATRLPGPPESVRRIVLLMLQRGPLGVPVGTLQRWRTDAWLGAPSSEARLPSALGSPAGRQ